MKSSCYFTGHNHKEKLLSVWGKVKNRSWDWTYAWHQKRVEINLRPWKKYNFFWIFTLFLGINPLKSNKKALNPAVNIICMVLIMNRGITVIDVTLFIIQIVTKHCHPILILKKKSLQYSMIQWGSKPSS